MQYMQEKLLDKYRVAFSKKLTTRVAVTAAISVAVIALLVGYFTQPVRSVESYCKVYKEQNDKLSNATGRTYGVTVFTHSSNRASDFINAFAELEKVSPDSIRPDVKTLREIFQTIDSNPAQTSSAQLSGMGAESSVKTWTNSNCNISQ
jgi:hypothetical protein